MDHAPYKIRIKASIAAGWICLSAIQEQVKNGCFLKTLRDTGKHAQLLREKPNLP
jgi:hypothetical protein